MSYQSPNLFLYYAAFSVNLLTLNIASMFSWSSPSIPKLYSNDTNINPLGRPITAYEESLIASPPSIGAVIGTVVAGMVADKIGRKKTLVIFAMPFIICYLVIANANNIYLFVIPRLILGVSGGCILCVLPSYVAEISEDSNRGFLGSIFGIMNSVGHLCSFGIGSLVSIETYAYFLLTPALLFFAIFVPFVPESPYYFLNKNDNNAAETTLKKIRKNSNVQKELLHLKDILSENKYVKTSWKDITNSSAAKNGLIASCGLLILQQLMGIPVILLYLQPILEASGNVIPSHLASVVIGFVQLLSCILSTFLIDRLGRKILLQISATGCCVSLFGLGMYFYLKSKDYDVDPIFWLPVSSLINFYVFFNIGYGSIPWTMSGELFATNVKSVCASISSFTGLTVCLIIVTCFPFIREAFGMSGVFFLFSCTAALSIVFVIIFVPETKGKSFQEIQNALCKNQKY